MDLAAIAVFRRIIFPARGSLCVEKFHGVGGTGVLDVTAIPMKLFPLKWRFTDLRYRVLPPMILDDSSPCRRSRRDACGSCYCRSIMTCLYRRLIPQRGVDASEQSRSGGHSGCSQIVFRPWRAVQVACVPLVSAGIGDRDDMEDGRKVLGRLLVSGF